MNTRSQLPDRAEIDLYLRNARLERADAIRRVFRRLTGRHATVNH